MRGKRVFKTLSTLRCAAHGPAAARKESFLLLTRHLFLSARARLGNVAGYYESSLAGLVYCWFWPVRSPLRARLKSPGGLGSALLSRAFPLRHPALRRVSSFLFAQRRRDREARKGFRATGLREKPRKDAVRSRFLHFRFRRSFRMTVCCAAILRSGFPGASGLHENDGKKSVGRTP